MVLRGDPYGDIPADVRKGSSNKPYGQGDYQILFTIENSSQAQ